MRRDKATFVGMIRGHKTRIGRIRQRGVVRLVVRVRVRLWRGDKEVETCALANSGYESETPQVLMPIKVVELLSLWPSLEASRIAFSRQQEGP